MASLKCFLSVLCFISLVVFTGPVIITESRPVKAITVAREALEAQFKKGLNINESAYEWPDRAAPGGPDPHHHFDIHL